MQIIIHAVRVILGCILAILSLAVLSILAAIMAPIIVIYSVAFLSYGVTIGIFQVMGMDSFDALDQYVVVTEWFCSTFLSVAIFLSSNVLPLFKKMESD